MRVGFLPGGDGVELYLIRHTTPDVAAGVCYGQAEIGLAASFAEEVVALKHKLAGLLPTACYSSPLRRCALLAAELVSTPQYDERLKELAFGAWEMQPWQDIPQAVLEQWGEDYVNVAPPGGETFGELHRRAAHFLQELFLRQHAGQVLVVTHAGVIRALLAEALNLPLQEVFRFHLDYGGVTQLQLGKSVPVVAYVNR
jgi:alpha-ribazole phosphatase